MSNQDTIASQKITTTDSNPDPFDVTNVTKDWDGLIYTFCWHSKEEQSPGYYPHYCIESWGKDNTLMLMEMFKDCNYSIQCRPHDYNPQNDR